MKKLVVLLAATLLSLTMVSASPVPCTVGSSNSVYYGSSSSPTFTCGTLTFSNFSIPNIGGTSGNPIGRVDIQIVSYDSVTGEVDITLNPNLQSSQGEALLFEVTGGVTQLDLGVGGNAAAVVERACSTPIPTTGPSAFLCPSSFLGQTVSFSNDPNAPVFSQLFPTTSPIYIFKDLYTYPGNPAGSGQLSEVTQSFEVGVVSPEPVSVLLLGSGLLGFGLLRRRVRKS